MGQLTLLNDRPRTLFVDIDDTLIRRRQDVEAPPAVLGHELLGLMVSLAVQQRRCSREQALARVQAVMAGKVWWDWIDYLRALELEPGAFWRTAAAEESHYLEPCHLDLSDHLLALAEAGCRCYITSNNPSSGIEHKLRLAGVHAVAHRVFADFLGTDRMQAMKGSPDFWRRALACSGAEPDDVIVIGDSPHDDVEVPRQVGIVRHVVVHREPGEPWSRWPGVQCAEDWSQVPAQVRRLAPRARAAGVQR